MTSEELKPCPFCGGTNLSIDTNSVQPDNFHDAHVDCDDCSAQGRHAMTLEGWLSSKEEAREEAITAWNRRATQPPAPQGQATAFAHVSRGTEEAQLTSIDISNAPQEQAASQAALVPKWAGEFRSFNEWVSHAKRALASPDHRRAICVDAKGRRCAIGKDFSRARDENAFPVRYFWECELAPVAASRAAVPEGFMLVPVEPTPEMVFAGCMHKGPLNEGMDLYSAIYAAMLAAAPSPQEGKAVEGGQDDPKEKCVVRGCEGMPLCGATCAIRGCCTWKEPAAQQTSAQVDKPESEVIEAQPIDRRKDWK